MTDNTGYLPQKLTLQDRKSLLLTGVKEIVSFDENQVVLSTGLGMLSVHGQGLHLKSLSPEGGQAGVDGTVTALIFEEPRPERRSWRSLWR